MWDCGRPKFPAVVREWLVNNATNREMPGRATSSSVVGDADLLLLLGALVIKSASC